jgi:sugar/nucleoside kinase (ribokinase family)
MSNKYDIAFLGHYTKDTIISKRGTRIVHGGAFNYGSNVAVRAGLKVAAISRLAKEDQEVVESLEKIGIDVFVTYTKHSTCLTLEYPTDDPDKRLMYVTSSAGAFTPEEVKDIEANAFVLGPSLHGEIPLDVLEELRKKDTIIAYDVQGYVRADVNGNVEYVDWDKAEMKEILSRVDMLKTDAVEAELITGEADKKQAAAILSSYGPTEIILTHRDGVLVYADKTYYEAKFTPKELIGRSGRGDTCIGAYVTKRRSVPPGEACIWAAAVTSLKMEAEGPFRRDISEVEKKIRKDYM